MSGSNIVPMPKSTAPAPMAYPWPMPPGGMPAGCCPPGGMDALLQCYCDIQAATAFISKVVQDLAANDPAFQQSLVDAIAASGSNIPLIGVTNGAAAQPGQVGEFVPFIQTVPTALGTNTQNVTMGVLQPGDWNVWADIRFPSGAQYTTVNFAMAGGVPPGFSDGLAAGFILDAASAIETVNAPTVQALISVPTLIAFSLTTTSATAGSIIMQTAARRMR